MLSATDIARARFCSTSRIEWPCARRLRMISSTRCTSLGESPSEGSSIRISAGLAISARPIASICCSPPLNEPPALSSRSASCGNSARTSSRSQCLRPAVAGCAAAAGERARRQRQVLAHRQRFEDAAPLRNDRDARLGDRVGRLALNERPAKTTSPRRGGVSPAIERISVVLPMPLRPRITTMRPACELEAQPVQHVAVAVIGVDLAHREQRLRRGQSRPPAPPGWSAPRPACRRE